MKNSGRPKRRVWPDKRSRIKLLGVFLFLALALTVYPQGFNSAQNIQPGFFPAEAESWAYPQAAGDRAVAQRYALWAKNNIDQGNWGEALAGLERASAFASVSSDISYLLALARAHHNSPRGTVLEALDSAIAVDRWDLYESEAARLMKVEYLLALKAYDEALSELTRVSRSPASALLTLKALAFLRPIDFRFFLTEALDRYPRDTEIARFFFTWLKKEDAAALNPGDLGHRFEPLDPRFVADSGPIYKSGNDDLEFLELVVRRLPVLLLYDAELAWMAAPFMRDLSEARRNVSAYRAVYEPVQASIPIALLLGVIDDETALEEFFAPREGKNVIDVALLAELWAALRREETRSIFIRNLSAYTGVLTEDANGDGIIETQAEYIQGMLVSCAYDQNQDGIPELVVEYEGGNPVRALAAIPPGSDRGVAVQQAGRALVTWERYPAVFEAELAGVRYIPRPLDFQYSPFRFIDFWGSGVLFPQRDPMTPPLTRRVMVFQSLRVERPSLEFSGGIEIVELNQGIPVRAKEYVGDLLVSETEFLRGRPQIQWVDLDLDGKMDTVRFFRKEYQPAELEDLWDYKRDIDYTKDNGDE